ncbi:transglycosylase domain-containing protein [Streptomyces sp. SP18CS02]|uniref:transglycosylase domain-containing protein n=1 Tax=Streptomyces sp. SP18CS02 TaxID=3002531 RepID=UPI002E765E3C|nr:transglycosylase domain-containing protein [Streptomyces sp. SP18CS02]MEE1754349.1 transglycosylase domain-containing protein [Streptomyces sp. SP18CS02]
MSEHRRKLPPQPQGGGRAAARRAAQQPTGRRAAQTRGSDSGSPSESYGEERPYGGRAEARRAAQRGPGRRRGAEAAAAGAGAGRGRGGPPGKKRLIDYPRHDKYGWRRWMPSWKLTSGLFLGFAASLLGAATIAYAMVEVPDPDKAATAQNNVYYWDDGTQMAATGGEINRQIIPIEEIPLAMQNAVISAENKTFRDDSGIDPMGIGRALFNMATGEQTQGGSTITQQYVKNNRLNNQSQTLSRKFKELFISIKVGTDLDKKDIMAGYLNTSYYGRGAYGIQAAARTYYNKDAQKLNPSECAFLASLLKGSTYYDPEGAPEIDPEATAKNNEERATKRWKWILDEMTNDGYLKPGERAKFTTFPMPLKTTKNAKLGGQIGYLVDLAKAYFINNNDRGITAQDLAQGGYEIHTTFNKKRVKDLETAVKNVYDANIDPAKRPKTDTHVQFGGASVDPETGAIVAIYGGSDATKHFTNNADQTGAQVGSTFKPFVLAAAMRDGVRDPNGGPEQGPDQRRLVDPDKSIYEGRNKLKIKNYDGSVWQDENGEQWLQTNDGQVSYKDINLRQAMIHSANSPFVQLGMDIGIPKVRQAAIDAGLRENSLAKANVPSFSIGISDPSAIRMAGSYATFAANGEQRDPYSVTKVDAGGKTVFEHEVKTKAAFSTAVASNVTDVLRDVVEDPEGTGKNARIPGRDVAGKTGTTDGNKSAWFVGYTPQLSTAIDMYRLDDNAENKNRKFLEMYGTGDQDKIHGSSFPSEIWQKYMSSTLKGEKVMRFPKPETLDAEAVYGGGAPSPQPTPSEKPSETPSQSPSPTPSQSSSSPSPEPDTSCGPFEWDCSEDNGGQNGGSDEGATDTGGSTTGGVTTSPSPPTGGNVNGNPTGGSGNSNGGGWLGGSEG